MRYINGISGCQKGEGVKEIETKDQISVRVIDCEGPLVALRVGVHPESALMTPEEARCIADLLNDAAIRADERAQK